MISTNETKTEPTDMEKLPASPQGLQVPMTRAERAQMIWEQMKKFLKEWLSENWGKLLLAVIGALVGIIALEIVTRGAITAALPVIMEIMTYIFVGMAILKIAEYLKIYLSEGWEGKKESASKNLAMGLASGAVELIMALGFKAAGAAFKAAGKVVKTTTEGVVNITKGAIRVVKTTAKAGVELVSKIARVAIKAGKFVFEGVQDIFLKGVKTLKNLSARLFGRFHFHGFTAERKGNFIWIYAHFSLGKIPIAIIPTGDLSGLIKKIKKPEELKMLMKQLDDPEVLKEFQKAMEGLNENEMRELLDNVIKQGARVTKVGGKEVIDYATKQLSDFMYKIEKAIIDTLGFKPFVDEANHVIPKLLKEPEILQDIKSLLHRFNPSGFHSILSEKLQNLRIILTKVNPIFPKMPLNDGKNFAGFVRRLSPELKQTLQEELETVIRTSYKQLLGSGDAYDLMLEQLEKALKIWNF